jgi:anti-sigma-K factor RskA
MSEPNDLIEQLRRSNRRWRALALAACSVLVLAALVGFVAMSREQMRTQQVVRELADAAANAQQAANSGQPR